MGDCVPRGEHVRSPVARDRHGDAVPRGAGPRGIMSTTMQDASACACRQRAGRVRRSGIVALALLALTCLAFAQTVVRAQETKSVPPAREQPVAPVPCLCPRPPRNLPQLRPSLRLRPRLRPRFRLPMHSRPLRRRDRPRRRPPSRRRRPNHPRRLRGRCRNRSRSRRRQLNLPRQTFLPSAAPTCHAICRPGRCSSRPTSWCRGS